MTWTGPGSAGGPGTDLALTWIYHADPVPTPDGRYLLALDDVPTDADGVEALVTRTAA